MILDHIGIATPDLDTGSAPYLALGLTPEGDDEIVEAQGVKVRVFRVGESLVELLAPVRPASAIARYLEKNRPGLHHTRVIFLHPKWGADTLIELVERPAQRAGA